MGTTGSNTGMTLVTVTALNLQWVHIPPLSFLIIHANNRCVVYKLLLK